MAQRLLLADDSVTIQKVVELVLAEEDFEIKLVSNGEDALNAVNIFHPDIVLADIEMPKLNGYQLCERIKQNPQTAHIPVVLLAGAFEPLDEAQAAQAGADDSLIKPFESHELISKLNAALAVSAAGVASREEPEDEAEELLELSDEAEEAIEAEAGEAGDEESAEVAEAEEDLWAMEEIPAGTAGPAEEEVEAEEVLEIEEPVDSAESAETEHAEETAMNESFEMHEQEVQEEAEPEPEEKVEAPGVQKEAVVTEEVMPAKEELLKIFEKVIDEKVSGFLSSIDIKDAFLSAFMPSMKDSIEKVLWEVAPELSEKMLKEILQGSIASLTSEVEKVIWETVPDLAGTMISKEIEKIKSEF